MMHSQALRYVKVSVYHNILLWSAFKLIQHTDALNSPDLASKAVSSMPTVSLYLLLGPSLPTASFGFSMLMGRMLELEGRARSLAGVRMS